MSGDNKWTCVVCCQDIGNARKKAIYAIGPCDHVVCYECSTRMRVLCKQNECPICRTDMPKVVFSRNRDLKLEERDLRKCIHVNADFGIYFEDEYCLDSYGRLLEHPCRKCKSSVAFRNLQDLISHLRKEHELFMCELCVKDLKVFSHERKYYNRKDLARHKKTGDPEETSHRGHPLCEFCDLRYYDDEDLQYHLKKEHFYCHFCDPTGLNQFYADYDALRSHFVKMHFVCEEGDCVNERFTSVFRGAIDLQAHIAQFHSANLSKSDMKKARTLTLDYFVRPRMNPSLPPTSSPGTRRKTLREVRSHPHEKEPRDESPPTPPPPVTVPRPEDFPTLVASKPPINEEATNSKGSDDKSSSKHNKFSICVSKNPSAVAKNEDEFPALPNFVQSNNRSAETFAAARVGKQTGGKLHNNNHRINPAMLEKPASVSSVSKINIVENHEEPNERTKAFQQSHMPILNNNADFPSLPMKSKKKMSLTLNAKPKGKSYKELVNGNAVGIKNGMTEKSVVMNMSSNERVKKIDDNTMLINQHQLKQPEVKKTFDLNGELFPVLEKPQKIRVKQPPGLSKKIGQKDKLSSAQSVKSSPRSQNPPPGLSGTRPSSSGEKSNSKAQQASSISLSSLAQEMVSINNNNDVNMNAKVSLYINPSDFHQRNQTLVEQMEKALDQSKFNSFKLASKEFRQGLISAEDYHATCVELLGNNHFPKLFTELLVLLPDIKKQNELLSAHETFLKCSKGAIPKKGGAWTVSRMDETGTVVCPNCQQVMKCSDGAEHMMMH